MADYDDFNDRIINCDDVMKIIKCGKTQAYKLIKLSNKLMQADGYNLYISGKTTLFYFCKLTGLKGVK